MRSLLAALLALPLLIPSATGTEAEAAPTHTDSRPVMGTLAEVQFSLGPESELSSQELSDRLFAGLKEIEARFSSYQPDSELSELSRLSTGDRAEISPPMHRLLAVSKTVHGLSGGAFDPTVQPLIELWGLTEPWSSGGRVPAPEVVRYVTSTKVGMDGVELSENGGKHYLRKSTPRRLALGAIAKGFAIDRGVELLAEAGAEDPYLSLGGDLYQSGCDTVGVSDPAGGVLMRISEVCDEAVATSSQARRGFTLGGTRYGHIIDPRSGWPTAAKTRSVTVVHPSATLADALSTAFFVMGLEETRSALNDWREWSAELERFSGLGAATKPQVAFLVEGGDGRELWLSEGLRERSEIVPAEVEGLS